VSCVNAYGALFVCVGESGSYICDAAGNATLINCTSESAALETCTGSATGGTGGGNPDSGTCTPGPYFNATCMDVSGPAGPCADCIDMNCCGPVDSCFADPICAGLYSCAADCSLEPDINQCVADTCPGCTSAVNAFNAIGECITTECQTPCSNP
jgi:hypothetical protein